MAIITVDEYKTFAGMTTTKEDTRLTQIIAGAEAAIENFLGYTPSVDETTQKIRTNANRDSYFVESPSAVVTAVTYQETGRHQQFATPLTLEDEMDYLLDADTGEIKLLMISDMAESGYELKDNGLLTVTYTPSVTFSQDIKLAVSMLTQYYYKEQYNQTTVTSSGQTVNYQVSKSLPAHISTLLHLHRAI